MNILLSNGLPEEYKGIPISADFRNMIQVDLILHDNDYTETEKTVAALTQLYPEIPQDIQKAIEGLEWFFLRGQKPPSGKKEVKSFDFEQDANLIYAAFYATYKISLTTIKFLHWWEFMALFEALPEDTLIQKVIYWRTADLSLMSKEERKYVLKMRKMFALKPDEQKPIDIAELNRRNKERVAQRFAEAQANLEKS